MYPSSSSFHLYNPHYNPLEDTRIAEELFDTQQQHLFTNDHNYHSTFMEAHENLALSNNTNMQSIMNNSSCNNGKFIALDGGNRGLTDKRSSKKDRHSKINTAQGPRDRRMRLSLDVAKKFFKLQDMLGFDKASNTIEWLIMKSKPAIRDLLTEHLNQSCSLMGVSSASSASECEVLSGLNDDQSTEKTVEDPGIKINKEKKKHEKVVRRSVYIDHSLAKETREKARARARKRTTEKRNIKLGAASCLDHVMDQNTIRLGSWIPFGENQVQTTDQADYASSYFQFKQGIGVGDNSFQTSSSWSPSLFNYTQNSGISHEHQFSEFQILGRPWEAMSN